MKFCKDCKFCKRPFFSFVLGAKYASCNNETLIAYSNETDGEFLASGKTILPLCSVMRIFMCGEEAEYFEPKK